MNGSRLSRGFVYSSLLVCAGVFGSAYHPARPTISVLIGHPSGKGGAVITATTSSQQLGGTEHDGTCEAALFSSDPSMSMSFDNSSIGVYASALFASDGTSYGGKTLKTETSGWPEPWHAAIWTSMSSAPTDLHPSGFFGSEILAMDSSGQGGFGYTSANGAKHPLLWSGSAASAVDLLPSGFDSGSVNSVLSGVQGGTVKAASGVWQAATWSGTAASFTNETPSGYQGGDILAMSSSDMVGWALPNGGGATEPLERHAFLWNGGTPIDLHPSSGAYSSVAKASDGSTIVGMFFATSADDAPPHACLWTGESASAFVDLHALLPSGYSSSVATGVYGNTVVGYATKPGQEENDAVIWQL
jgi:hypothetical protein